METVAAIDALEDLIHNSKPVPLTDDVRLDRGDLLEALARTAPVDQLEMIAARAKPVPLTDHVRVDRDSVNAQCDALRLAIPEAVKRRRESERGPEPATPVQAITAEEAAKDLSQLLQRAKFGNERFTITLGGVRMADLQPPDDE